MMNGLVVEFVFRSITGNARSCGTVMARRRNLRGHLREPGGDICFEAGMRGLKDWLDRLDDDDLGAEGGCVWEGCFVLFCFVLLLVLACRAMPSGRRLDWQCPFT